MLEYSLQQSVSVLLGIMAAVLVVTTASGQGDRAPGSKLAVAVAVDHVGNLFIADADKVRKVTPDGKVSVVAGGSWSPNGDGGIATAATLTDINGITVDSAGNLFIAHSGRISKVTPEGAISRVAGRDSSQGGFAGDGGQATLAWFDRVTGLAVDRANNLYLADRNNNRIRRVTPDGIVSTAAGDGNRGFSGDGGPATSASLNGPRGVAVDEKGNLFIADTVNQRVRKVSSNGVIETVAGTGGYGFSGDSGQAKSTQLGPSGVAIDALGNLFISDVVNARIRKVQFNGEISTVAGAFPPPSLGRGSAVFGGDGGPAVSALLDSPYGVAVDASGNLYIADYGNDRVRKVNASGIISSIAPPPSPFPPVIPGRG